MAYLALLGSAMFFAMVALLVVRRHIPGREVLLPRHSRTTGGQTFHR
jgi:AAHS family 4-hydroxybenzoate transporter-like MFS transporter